MRNDSRDDGTTNLHGHATLCTPTGERYAYDVAGDANRSGTIDDLWLEYGDPTPELEGLFEAA